jgi:hypothetical protein
MAMDLLKANVRDLHLLALQGLEPLNVGLLAGAGELTAAVSNHNARTARCLDRVRALIEARGRLADVGLWLNVEAADIAAERSRVEMESWSTLLELARVIEERKTILQRMEVRFNDDWERATDAHDQAVAAAEKRLAPERRTLEKINPRGAAGYLAELVAEDPVVAQTAAQLRGVQTSLQGVRDMRRGLVFDSGTLLVCQRETFEGMVGRK